MKSENIESLTIKSLIYPKKSSWILLTSSDWTNADWSIRLLSMFKAAMSLTMTAHLKFSAACLVSNICLSKVVLPAPRNPQSKETGKRLFVVGLSYWQIKKIIYDCEKIMILNWNWHSTLSKFFELPADKLGHKISVPLPLRMGFSYSKYGNLGWIPHL